MFCRKCGFQLPDDSLFCSKCGTNLQTDTLQKNNLTNNNVQISSNYDKIKSTIADKFSNIKDIWNNYHNISK